MTSEKRFRDTESSSDFGNVWQLTNSAGELLAPTHAYCPQRQLDSPNWKKNRQEKKEKQGEEFKKPSFTSGFGTHILCASLRRIQRGDEGAAAEREISQ